MRSSSQPYAVRWAVVLLFVSMPVSRSHAQSQGFGVERFSPSAPGAGWLAMDALDLHGGLGGALGLTLGYARNPFRVAAGSQSLAVVSSQAFADIGGAITYGRWRVYLNLDMPLVITGESGNVGDTSFVGPSVNPAANPDVLTDARIGFDVRIIGRPEGRFRFGLGAQLFVPFGSRADYETDDTFRGAVRALFAGDVGRFTYAAHIGVHIRPLDDASSPESPHGSELLFGVAVGAKLPITAQRKWAVVVGPEIFGASAYRAFFGANGTALEGLASARLEGTSHERLQVRVKLGVGAGLYQHFGAPEWRVIAGIEMFKSSRPASSVPQPTAR